MAAPEKSPAIVAECWTCRGDNHAWCERCAPKVAAYTFNHAMFLKNAAAEQSHRAAGHDVREVRP